MPSRLAQTSSSGGEGGGEEGAGAGAVQESSPRSAVGIAWEAFKGNGGGDSLAATVKAAVTATTIAVEHVRKRTRERLLLEKGAGGGGKRLSGPVQITLEDLQVGWWWWWWLVVVDWCGGLAGGVRRLRPVSLDVSCVARVGLCDGFVALAKSAYHSIPPRTAWCTIAGGT